MALGAVAAYQKAGYPKEEWPVIFGIDGLDDALKAIESGEMQGTVYNDKEDQAMEMAKLAIDIFLGNTLSIQQLEDGRYYTSQYQQVDRSNVNIFLNQ